MQEPRNYKSYYERRVRAIHQVLNEIAIGMANLTRGGWMQDGKIIHIQLDINGRREEIYTSRNTLRTWEFGQERAPSPLLTDWPSSIKREGRKERASRCVASPPHLVYH